MCDDGHTYERGAIAQWLQQPRGLDDNGRPLPPRSPLTNLALRSVELRPNIALRKSIEAWLEIYPNLRMKAPRMNLEDVRVVVEGLQADAGSKASRFEAVMAEKDEEIVGLKFELEHAKRQRGGALSSRPVSEDVEEYAVPHPSDFENTPFTAKMCRILIMLHAGGKHHNSNQLLWEKLLYVIVLPELTQMAFIRDPRLETAVVGTSAESWCALQYLIRTYSRLPSGAGSASPRSCALKVPLAPEGEEGKWFTPTQIFELVDVLRSRQDLIEGTSGDVLLG